MLSDNQAPGVTAGGDASKGGYGTGACCMYESVGWCLQSFLLRVLIALPAKIAHGRA